MYGNWEGYFETGSLMCKGRYKKGLRNGLYEEFYDNGEIKKQELYKMGIRLAGKNHKD